MCVSRQCRSGAESRQRRQQIVEPFLVDGAANGEDPDGTLRVGPVVAAMRFARRWKPPRIDPVVIEVHGSARARELAQMPRIDLGAGRDPRAGIELLAFLPLGCRPDVLGMRRAAPGRPRKRAAYRVTEAGVCRKCACSWTTVDGNSAASTKACPRRRIRLRVGSRRKSRHHAATAVLYPGSRRAWRQRRRTRAGSWCRYSGR